MLVTRWRTVGTAPKDGTAALVHCIGTLDCHLAHYVDGTWMEQSGACVLPETDRGSRTHRTPLPTRVDHLKRVALCLILTSMGVLGGLVRKHFRTATLTKVATHVVRRLILAKSQLPDSSQTGQEAHKLSLAFGVRLLED